MQKEYFSYSEEETERIAKELAANTDIGVTIALHGNLGAGKTVFSRGFARGLGITEPISSPTFTIIQEYEFSEDKIFYHLDLYRITDSNAALAFGLDEYLDDDNSIMLIEWSERIEDLLPKNTLHIFIIRKGDTEREIIVSSKYIDNLLNLEWIKWGML